MVGSAFNKVIFLSPLPTAFASLVGVELTAEAPLHIGPGLI